MRNDDTAHGAGRTDYAQNPLPHPDLAAAGRFLSLLDETADTFTFQAFDDNKTRKDGRLAHIRHGTLEQHALELTRANGAGCGIFVMVQKGDGKGRKNENVVRIRAVFIEDDGDGKPPPIEPHITVESSPAKYHHYFLVDGLTVDEYRGVQERLVQDYGSDPNAKDPARVLRLPGFYHLKDPDNPHKARIVHESGAAPYSRDDILRAFPPVERPKRKPSATSTGKIPEGRRNTHLTGQAGAMRRRDMSESAILAALLVENAERCDPPLDETEVQRIAQSIAKYPPHNAASVNPTTENSGSGAAPAFDQDILSDLTARLAVDPGYAFKADVLRALVLLDERDGQTFDAIYSDLNLN